MGVLVGSYGDFFERATGVTPYPYQRKLADKDWPQVLNVPTGAGKTAAVSLAWIYRREQFGVGGTRLVFCLPMRVLVTQTVENIRSWLTRLGLEKHYGVHQLMGGVLEEEWELEIERPNILVGTQDQLLSRALNRGYSMSRYRWSIPFGLLNNDCQWVFDEVQLMDVARQTSAQLQAFRDRMGTYGSVGSLWMSATLQTNWLETVDHPRPERRAGLESEDLAFSSLSRRVNASKALGKAPVSLSKENKKEYCRQVADWLLTQHVAGSLSLVVVNRVDRAVEIYQALQKKLKVEAQPPELLLLHSRFRPGEREAKEKALRQLQEAAPLQGAIIVSTQVVEAGVDLSARLLATELAPFSSLVQRMGRCNRDGLQPGGGLVAWLDVQDDLLPYDEDILAKARELLGHLESASPSAIEKLMALNPSLERTEPAIILRRKDLLELFETTSDLAGEDVDVSQFIRSGRDLDSQIFWRILGDDVKKELLPCREELCSVSVSGLKDFLSKDRRAYRWNYAEEVWQSVDKDRVTPGQFYMIDCKSGGYSHEYGFTKESKAPVPPVKAPGVLVKFSDDRRTFARYWLSLWEHTNGVAQQMRTILAGVEQLALPTELLTKSCLWHDYGKSHTVFQQTMVAGQQPPTDDLWAKTVAQNRHGRAGFRHEFASALAALQHRVEPLVVFLVATHHGKVRFSVRPIPQEQISGSTALTIRGVEDGDVLPPIDWPGLSIPEGTVLQLEAVQLGADNGWSGPLLDLIEDSEWGPFRLGFLEAMMRNADVRCSRAEGEQYEKR